VLLAYVDESGDTGDVAQQGSSHTYSLGCLLIEDTAWPTAFDEILTLRRNLRAKFGLPMRAEVKASYLIRSGGPIRALNLTPTQRRLIFRAHLRVLTSLPARAFAIVIDKRNGNHSDVFDTAWETLFQRLERTSTKEQQTLLLMHDEGENDRVRAWLRRSRRYLTAGGAYGGSFRYAATQLIDDAVPRKSQHSYFIQVADLIAYAAFRSVVAPGANVARVCPKSTWNQIGVATHVEVNRVRPRAAPGIVYRP
jgi:hypothetical protein